MLYYLIGIFIGVVIEVLYNLITTGYGTMYIDKSNQDVDKYHLEIKDLDTLDKKRRIKIKVIKTNSETQK